MNPGLPASVRAPAINLKTILASSGLPILLTRATSESFEAIFQALALEQWEYSITRVGEFCEATYRVMQWELTNRSHFTPLNSYLGQNAFSKLHATVENQRPDLANISSRLQHLYRIRNQYGPHLKLTTTEPEYADHATTSAKVLLYDLLRALGIRQEHAVRGVSQAANAGTHAATKLLKSLQPLLRSSERRWFERFCVQLDKNFFARYVGTAFPPAFTSPSITWSHVVNAGLIQRSFFANLANFCRHRADANGAAMLVIVGNSGSGKTGVLKWLAFQLSTENRIVFEVVNPDPMLRLELLNSQRDQASHCFLFMDEPFVSEPVPTVFDWESFPAAVTFVLTSKPSDWNTANKTIRGFDLTVVELSITQEDILAVHSHPLIVDQSLERQPEITDKLATASTYRELVFQAYTGRLFTNALYAAVSSVSGGDRMLLSAAATFSGVNLAVPTPLYEKMTGVKQIGSVVENNETLRELLHVNEMLPFEAWEMKESDISVILPKLRDLGHDSSELFVGVATYVDVGSKPERRFLLHLLRRLSRRGDLEMAETIVHSDGFFNCESEMAIAAGPAELFNLWIPILTKLGRNELAPAWTSIALDKLPETADDCLAQVNYLVRVKEFARARQVCMGWLEAHPEESMVRAEHIALVRKAGYSPAVMRTIAENMQWIGGHANDQLVRVSLLALLRQWADVATVRRAVDESLQFLQGKQGVSESCWAACLSLVGDFGTLVQKESAVDLAKGFIARSAPTQIFWCACLPLLRGYHDDQLVSSIIDRLTSSEDYGIRLALARTRMVSGKAGVAADVDQLLKEQPSNYGALMLKAQLLLSREDFSEAKDILKELASKSTRRYKSGFLRWLAEAEAGLGDAPAAELAFSDSIRLASAAARPSLLNARGVFYARIRRYDYAEADFKMASLEDPALLWADFNLGALYCKLGRDEGEKHFQVALSKVTPNSRYVSTARLLDYVKSAKAGRWPRERGSERVA